MLHPFPNTRGASENDTKRLWSIESAVQWGKRNGLEGQHIQELQEFCLHIKSAELSASDLKGGTTLDSGSFGTIEKTMFHGVPVAVKRFIKDQTGAKSLAQVLRDAHLELSILCSTKHPQIVSFLGVPAYFPTETDPDQSMSFGFVFEFCAHGSLFSLLHEKNVKFSFQEKIRMLKELAMALVYLHSEQIIHRDLSSRNILLTDDLRVKLADFGCARKISGGMYQPTTISGNPPWMSPEQLGGLPLTFSADVFSFGVVFWEFITEAIPWNDVPSELWAMRQLVFENGNHLPIPQMSSCSPETRDEAIAVSMLIKRTFLRVPQARPTMPAILNALQAVHEQRVRGWIDECTSARRTDLESRLSLFFEAQQLQVQNLPSNEEIGLLAKLHCEDVDDGLINLYLFNKYKADLSNIRPVVSVQPPPECIPQQQKYSAYLCNACPHFYGETLNGHHEMLMPCGYHYLGDLLNGTLHGLGILTAADGSKLQGEFQNNQLSTPFSVENMRLSMRLPESGMNDAERLTAQSQKLSPPVTSGNISLPLVGALDSKKATRANIVVDQQDNTTKKTSDTTVKVKSETYTCRDCPHFFGEPVSGHHELRLPDGSRYVGDTLNGSFHGLGILTTGEENGSKLQGQFQNNQLVMPFLVENIRSTLKANDAVLSSVSAPQKIQSVGLHDDLQKSSGLLAKAGDSLRESPVAKPSAPSGESRKLSPDKYNDLVSSYLEIEKQCANTGKIADVDHQVLEVVSVAQNGGDHMRLYDGNHQPQHQNSFGMYPRFDPSQSNQTVLSKRSLPATEFPMQRATTQAFGEGKAPSSELPLRGTPAPQLMFPLRGTPGPQLCYGQTPNEIPRNGTPAPTGNFSVVRHNVDLPRSGTPGPQYNFAMQSLDKPRAGSQGPQNPNYNFQGILPPNAIPLVSGHDPAVYSSNDRMRSAGLQYPQSNFTPSHLHPPQQQVNYSLQQSTANFAQHTNIIGHQFIAPAAKQMTPVQSLVSDRNLSRPPLSESRTESHQNVMYGAMPLRQYYAAATAPVAEKRRLVETNNGVLLETQNHPSSFPPSPYFWQNGAAPAMIQHPNHHGASMHWR